MPTGKGHITGRELISGRRFAASTLAEKIDRGLLAAYLDEAENRQYLPGTALFYYKQMNGVKLPDNFVAFDFNWDRWRANYPGMDEEDLERAMAEILANAFFRAEDIDSLVGN